MIRAVTRSVVAVMLTGVVACGTPTLGDVPLDPRGISGVVSNGARPEGGVWVIAETDSLPTHFQRMS